MGINRPKKPKKREAPPPAPPPPPPRRKALTNVGGKVEVETADAALGAVLERALAVTAGRDSVLRHVHGFHSYPARMHPDTAATLVRELVPAGALVLDPFCGSGTVLVESRIAGRRALGVDANPLAVELSWLKTGGLAPAEAEHLVTLCEEVASHAEDRRLAKAGPSRKYGQRDRELFDTHMLLELDGLRQGLVKAEAPRGLQRAAWLVLSSILTKVSRQPGDTADDRAPRRLASGFAIRLFVNRARLLRQQLEELWQVVPPDVPAPRVRLGDARELAGIRPRSIDLVVASPPYPGIYDYHTQHATRLRWLGLDSSSFEERELGARRRMERLSHNAALTKWSHELGDVLAALRRVLAPGGRAALLIADSVLGTEAAYADQLVAVVGARMGLCIVGRASQERAYFHEPTRRAFRFRPRREHLLVLGRQAPTTGRPMPR